MKNRTKATSIAQNKAKSPQPEGWAKVLFGPLIVGVVVLIGQILVNPEVAKRVRIQESITQKRYEVCENAVNLLQRRLASVQMTGRPIPEWYVPPEKNPPTQVEMNVTYTLLTIYGKSDELAKQFYAATGPGKTKPSDIVKFVSAVRKELGVDEDGFTGDEFHYRILRPLEEHADKESIGNGPPA